MKGLIDLRNHPPPAAHQISAGFSALVRAVFATLFILSLFSAQAQIVVNSTGDKPNAFPLITGICSTDTIERGECTLRAAIQLANFNPDLTTIAFNIPTADPNYVPDRNPLISIPLSSALPALSTS